MHRTTLPLRLERVGFAARGVVLLSGLTLRVERQRRTVVIGPNGAGKSLLLRLCHGLLAPSEGRILCNGGTEGVGPDVRARQAMVFQRPVHLRRSAFANLTYALGARGVPRPQRRARAMAALERFGLGRLADRPLARFRAASSSGWHWPGPGCWSRSFFSWMSRRRTRPFFNQSGRGGDQPLRT